MYGDFKQQKVGILKSTAVNTFDHRLAMYFKQPAKLPRCSLLMASWPFQNKSCERHSTGPCTKFLWLKPACGWKCIKDEQSEWPLSLTFGVWPPLVMLLQSFFFLMTTRWYEERWSRWVCLYIWGYRVSKRSVRVRACVCVHLLTVKLNLLPKQPIVNLIHKLINIRWVPFYCHSPLTFHPYSPSVKLKLLRYIYTDTESLNKFLSLIVLFAFLSTVLTYLGGGLTWSSFTMTTWLSAGTSCWTLTLWSRDTVLKP